MKIEAVLVPDIRRFTRLPGAIQYDATNRVIWFACPCGCGAVGELVFGALADKPYRDRHKPSLRDGLTLGIAWQHGGLDIVHWEGTLQDGVFDGIVSG